MLIKIGQPLDRGFDEPLGLLTDCHRRIEYFLQILCAVTDAARGERLSDKDCRDVEAALRYFVEAAPRHTADEEESLFPRLRASRDPEARHAVEVMDRLEHDHRDAEVHHAALDTLMRQWLLAGTLGFGRLSDLRGHLEALRTMYAEHIAVEDRELFPAARRLLSRAEVHDIGREMAARRSRRTP